jgi:hypothetical protein
MIWIIIQINTQLVVVERRVLAVSDVSLVHGRDDHDALILSIVTEPGD